jgi:hypothetical protein
MPASWRNREGLEVPKGSSRVRFVALAWRACENVLACVSVHAWPIIVLCQSLDRLVNTKVACRDAIVVVMEEIKAKLDIGDAKSWVRSIVRNEVDQAID